MDWKESILSEVNQQFVSNPYPGLNEEIVIRVRFLKNNDVKRVFLRTILNGADRLLEMQPENAKKNFVYYCISIKMSQPSFQYHFVLDTASQDFIYATRAGITTYAPTEDHDYVILADFQNPDWIASSVFYQIFPDRFFNGNKEHKVKTNEYEFEGHKTIAMDWDQPPLSYEEGHCLDFYGGDLEGIRQKIDYFKELGVNALFLNPIFSGKTSHRYDCVDFFEVDQHLGGNRDLVRLTDDLHQNDMKIIIDISINHTGIDHQWFQKAFQDPGSRERNYYFFDEKNNYIGWENVESLPKLNYTQKDLHDIIYQQSDSVLQHYLKEPYRIDGWRFDVGNHTANLGPDQLGSDLFKKIRKVIKSVNPRAYILAEHWLDNISFLLGDRWDGAMNYFSSARPLRNFMGTLDRFLTTVSPLKRQCKAVSALDLSKMLWQHFTRIPNQLAFLQYNLLNSHDLYRLHNYREIFDWEIYRGIMMVLFLLPGATSIYYGDEIGIDGEITTVEGIRYPMPWKREKWNLDHFNLYKTLAHLKQKEKALHYGCYKVLLADEETLVLARFNAEKGFAAVLSRNTVEKKISLPLHLIGARHNCPVREIFSGQTYAYSNGCFDLTIAPRTSSLLAIEIEE